MIISLFNIKLAVHSWDTGHWLSKHSFAISTKSRIYLQPTNVFRDPDTNLFSNNFANILQMLPTKLIGLKSLTFIALAFLGINAIKEASRDFFEFTVVIKLLKDSHHIHMAFHHLWTMLKKGHSKTIWSRGFISPQFLLRRYLSKKKKNLKDSRLN